MAYIVKADVTGLLGSFTIPAHWTADSDAYLNLAITRATKKIDRFTRCRFEVTRRTITLKGDGTHVLLTMQRTYWPINSIHSIVERAAYDETFADDGETVDSDNYDVHASRRAIENHYATWAQAAFYNFQADISFGYTETPPEIKQAAVLLVQEEITPGTIEKVGQFDSEKFPDGYSYTRSAGADRIVSKTGSTTGFGFVDDLLKPFQFKLPVVVAMGG